MRYYKQTKKYSKKTRGNCFQTAVACFLNIPPENVPNIEVFYDIPDFDWLDPFNAWLNHKGYIYRSADEFRCFHIYNEADALLYEKRHQRSIQSMKSELKFHYYFVSGISPRNKNIKHIVIYQAGYLIHDPFPGASEGLYLPPGVKEIDSFSFSIIEKL